MQIRAVERWLDEGWSPWRIAYGTVALVGTVGAVYGYASHPHHPGAVWWLLGGALVVALWAMSEMMRWRIKYKRLQTSATGQDIAQATSQPSEAGTCTKLRNAIAGGRVLQSKIKSGSRGQEYVPAEIGPDVVRWEADVSETLASYPVKQAEFEFSVSLLHNITGLGDLFPDSANQVIEHALTLLKSYIDDIEEAEQPNHLPA